MTQKILNVTIFENDKETLKLSAVNDNELKTEQEKLNAFFLSILQPTDLTISATISKGFNTQLTAEIIARALLQCNQSVHLKFSFNPSLTSDSDSDSDYSFCDSRNADFMRENLNSVIDQFRDTLLNELTPGTFPFGTRIHGVSDKVMGDHCYLNDKFHEPRMEFLAATKGALGHDIAKYNILPFANSIWLEPSARRSDQIGGKKPSPTCY